MAAVPESVTQYKRTLLEAASHGHVSARHQMLEVAKQCDAWTNADRDNFWPGLAARGRRGGRRLGRAQGRPGARRRGGP
jgi:hypothetical protein